jgi:hypothetical protein
MHINHNEQFLRNKIFIDMIVCIHLIIYIYDIYKKLNTYETTIHVSRSCKSYRGINVDHGMNVDQDTVLALVSWF